MNEVVMTEDQSPKRIIHLWANVSFLLANAVTVMVAIELHRASNVSICVLVIDQNKICISRKLGGDNLTLCAVSARIPHHRNKVSIRSSTHFTVGLSLSPLLSSPLSLSLWNLVNFQL